jgi:hypothetical protein
MGQMNLPPIHPWGDPEAHHLDFLPEKLFQMLGWGMTVAEPPLNSWFDFDPSVLGGPPPAPEMEPEPLEAVA